VQTDYYRLNVYRNGTFWSNLTNTTTFSLWEGLPASTLMTFNSTTEDLSGNRNLTHWQNASVMLPACGLAPIANFIANNVTTCKDIPVVFNDTSTNTPTTWHYVMTPGGWDSHYQNFTHAFDTAGLYTVELTAGNAYGSDIETKNDYINVSDCTPIPTPTPTPTPAPSISCFFTNITGATLEPNSSSWTLTSGGITWGMTITNESQGNISFFNCGGATLKNGGGSGGGEAAGAAFGIIGGIIGGLIVIRRKKP
jgi:PKD repeat protein